jgi:hypothetical protein
MPLDPTRQDGWPVEEAGQLVQEGDTEPDAEPQLVGDEFPPLDEPIERDDPDADREDLDAWPSAEEAAVHVVDEDELPGGVDAPGDGYGDDPVTEDPGAPPGA